MSHRNARLTIEGRQLLVERVFHMMGSHRGFLGV